MLIIYIIFLVRGFIEDTAYINRLNKVECPGCQTAAAGGSATPSLTHQIIVETMSHENHHGKFVDSKVKRILSSTRDQIVRGIIMGAIEGSPMMALQGAITWSLAGGIVSGVGDLLGWKTRFVS